MTTHPSSLLNHQPTEERHERVSELLPRICEAVKDERVSIGYLVKAFGHRGFGLLLIFFTAIPALPVPAQGIATILSVPVLILCFQMLAGKRTPWIPQWISKKTIKRSTLQMVGDKFTPYVKKFERLSRPRFLYMTSRQGERMTGLIVMLCGISMALPIPFSNTVPSIAIVVMSLGLIERDGLAVKAGMLIGLLGITVTTLVVLSLEHFITESIAYARAFFDSL